MRSNKLAGPVLRLDQVRCEPTTTTSVASRPSFSSRDGAVAQRSSIQLSISETPEPLLCRETGEGSKYICASAWPAVAIRASLVDDSPLVVVYDDLGLGGVADLFHSLQLSLDFISIDQ